MRTSGGSARGCAVACMLIQVCMFMTGCRMVVGGDMGGGSWDSQIYPPARFGSRVSSPDLTLYWNCARPDPTLVQVDGVAQNTSGDYVRFVRFELVGIDASGKDVSEGEGSLRATILYLNQTSPFAIQVKAAGTEVRFDLHYRYTVQGFGDGGSGSDGGYMARDACSPTQHRNQSLGY
jgi:hypothetical protein